MATSKINLQLILKGCLEGNRLSQERLYQHFYGYAMSICLRYARHYKEAEEILNDGFLKVFDKMDRYDPAYPFRGWLRQLLVNVAIDYYRKHRKYYLTFISGLVPEQIEDPSPMPAIDRDEDVLPIVQQLSPHYRIVFNLYVMEGYKHHEIAEKLNISVGTSKSNLARAKVRLRELWLKKKEVSKRINEHG